MTDDEIKQLKDAQAATDSEERTRLKAEQARTGTHVFEGEPDKRQQGDTAHKVSRFRPTYRALTDEEKALHDAIKTKAAELEDLFEQIRTVRGFGPGLAIPGPAGRYLALAMTDLELAVMWAVKALTS